MSMTEETIDTLEALFKLIDKRVGVFQTTEPGKTILDEHMDRIRELELNTVPIDKVNEISFKDTIRGSEEEPIVEIIEEEKVEVIIPENKPKKGITIVEEELEGEDGNEIY